MASIDVKADASVLGDTFDPGCAEEIHERRSIEELQVVCTRTEFCACCPSMRHLAIDGLAGELSSTMKWLSTSYYCRLIVPNK